MGFKNKPSQKIDWGNAGVEPSSGKKTSGYAVDEKVPEEYHNWLHTLLTGIQNWLQGSNEDWIVVDSDTDEGDYLTMAAYLADAPAVGDRVLLKVDETIAAKMTFPSGIRVKRLKGTKFSVTANLAEVLEIGTGVEIEGDLKIELAHTGTIAEAVSWAGNDSQSQNIILENTSTGVVTNAFVLNAAAKANMARGEAINSGGGSITNKLVDNSGVLSNDIEIRERT